MRVAHRHHRNEILSTHLELSSMFRHFIKLLMLLCLISPFVLRNAAASAAELLVADRATNSILAFNPNSGAFVRTLVGTGLDEPTDLAFGPAGLLYVADRGSNRVLMFDPTTGASQGTFASGLLEPSGLLYDAINNQLLVAELDNFQGQNILRYNSAGGLLQTINAGPTGHSGMVFGSGGDLFASAFITDPQFSGAVQQFDDLANNYASLGIFASGGGLSGASGLTFGADGNLYVTGLFSQNIVKYPVTNGVAGSGAQFGNNVAYPSEIIIGPDSNFLVTSLGNSNPGDPIYGTFLFPGLIYKVDPLTGTQTPFITNGQSFQPTAVLLSLVPEPTSTVLVLGAVGILAANRMRRRTSLRRQL
jgi:hypothetical protein